MQRYFVDETLIEHQLISLKKLSFIPTSTKLEKNQDISIKLYIDNAHIYEFKNCHIDNTDDRRLRVPDEVMIWLRRTFAFSIAFFASHRGEKKGIWKNNDIKTFDNALNKKIDKKTGKQIKMDVPGETILLKWVENEKESYLAIGEGFKITPENAMEYLSEKALSSILPYIFTTVKNTSIADIRTDGKKCYVIDRTTDWLSVEQYSETSFSHPGLYLLRRKISNGEYAYYVGKAADIKNRIRKNSDKVSHPDEKDEDNKQYDEIACISIKFDDFIKLYGELNDDNRTEESNPGVKRGSATDNALYAVEDIAIHVAAMLLRSEGKKLDNKQYRSYTSQWINGI